MTTYDSFVNGETEKKTEDIEVEVVEENPSIEQMVDDSAEEKQSD